MGRPGQEVSAGLLLLSPAAAGSGVAEALGRGSSSGARAPSRLREGAGCRGSSEGAAEDGGGGDVALVDWIDPIWEDPEVDAGVWRRRVRERWDN